MTKQPAENTPIEQARMLVGAASVSAVSSFVPLLGKFPALQAVKTADWDFFMTVAGVGTAFATVANCAGEEEGAEICSLIVQDLENWNSDGHRALIDLLRYLKKADDAGGTPPLTLGSWVLMNVKGSNLLTDAEYEIAQVVGTMLLIEFLGWFRRTERD